MLKSTRSTPRASYNSALIAARTADGSLATVPPPRAIFTNDSTRAPVLAGKHRADDGWKVTLRDGRQATPHQSTDVNLTLIGWDGGRVGHRPPLGNVIA